ncbi:hypothetical protein E2C01_048270 [Portunus trituberculatus]|uniref:Uncharacterized protein n=1 Tax=Portunus trituberculatus TaxID=210409 RepID=A0A5B7G2Q5_PORTR|nr:hypothetical protein [Portunus trituberculatus]
MNKAPANKRSAEAISEELTFTASPVESQYICLAAGHPRETIIHVKKACRTPWKPTPLLALLQLGTSRCRVSFSEGSDKTLAQIYEWFMALLKQHLSLEPLMKEGEPRLQLLSLLEGAVPNSVHLFGLSRFRMGLYTPEPDLCGHCSHFEHQSWKCKLVLYCSCPAISISTPAGAAALIQSREAQPLIPVTLPPVPVPHRTAPNYVTVVGAAGAALASQAGMPTEVKGLSVRVTALERQRDASTPLPQLVLIPVQPVPQPAHENQPLSVPPSPLPQPMSAPVQPVPDNQHQRVAASPQPQPVTPDCAGQSLAPASQATSTSLATAPTGPGPTLSVADRTPSWSGSSSEEADLDCILMT